MDNIALLFVTLGGLLLAGLAADTLGRRTRLPRVTLLLIIGVAAGPFGLGLISHDSDAWFELASTAALALVAFLLGNALTVEKLAEHGREILIVTWTLVAATLAFMTLGLSAMGLAPGLALLLAAIGTATAPAATVDVLAQARASGPFADRIRGIVAVDDAWGIIVFSLVLVIVSAMGGNGAEAAPAPIWNAARDLGGAILVGFATGLPAAFLTGRLSPGEPQQSEALGTVFLTAGLAIWLDVSPLLAGITAGAVVANLARHHERAFHEIEHVEWPFMLLFFILAGASLEVDRLPELGLIGLAFVALRTAARLAGCWLGGTLAKLPTEERRWMGPALLPQAGVAVGMALVAGEAFPGWRETIITLTVGTTVVFELIGPPATMMALARVRAQSVAPGSRIT
ncbi:cation:proton antiporter [Roseibacterium sp. SDUM158017]|uniref:cation:proton antiporter n=1 Tax=Roseicyclus salinarum TaxID=3036773 RepID=UPI00241558FB|nr:cation:proton antiporter [Roseibacterium sp. SDUM158017]MDG4647447.1 cation:proton antiporter [Roseibacterium sp. SDUM158017]